MYAYQPTLAKPPPPRLVDPALPEDWPPEGAHVVEDLRNLDLTGWWVEPCWLCDVWIWAERRVNEIGSPLPPQVNAHGRVFEHCSSTWKVTPALFVPYAGA